MSKGLVEHRRRIVAVRGRLRCRQRYEADGSDAALLLRLVGERRFLSLQQAFGGRRIWIPKAGERLPCLACGRRNHCVRAWHRDGRSVGAVAGLLGLSAKTVYRVLSQSRPRRRKE